MKYLFQYLKITFLNINILKHFDPNLVIVLKMNASNSIIAEYLLQVNASSVLLCLIVFYSRKLIPTEERYNIGDKELLAIVECL
jgi:hypothetical protein